MNKKLLSFIFTENSNFGVSMLSALANKHGWETDIYFVESDLSDYSKIKDFILGYQPDIINFSFKSFERNQALDLANYICNLNYTSTSITGKIIRIIAGGIHPTLMPYEIKNTGFFDAVIIGDGMGIWEDLLDNYRYINNIKIHGKQHPDKNVYTNFFYSKSQIERMKSTETATVLTSIGCPYKCSFCHSGSKNFFPLPIENVAKYVIELYRNYNVRNFHFLDDLFSYNLKRLQKFRELLGEAKISFSSQVSCRVDKFNDEIAQEFVKLGVETVNFGIETLSERLLMFLNKNITPNECYEAVETCHKHGLNCTVNLMFGIPSQQRYDYERNLEFIKKAKPDSVNCFIYTPYPGTKLYEFCFDYGYLNDKFDENKFDWFTSNKDGINNIQIKLNKIDYNLANEYIEKVNELMNKDAELLKKLEMIDKHPWVLIGTTRHYYFIKLINKLSHGNFNIFNNFLGYINMDKGAGFKIESVLKSYNNEVVPSLFVTYSFLDGTDFKNTQRYIKNKFNKKIPLISISSFKRSSTIEDIKRLCK